MQISSASEICLDSQRRISRMPPISMAADLSLGRHTPTITQTLSFLRAGSKPENSEQSRNYLNVLEFYLKTLEDERQKIEAFKRELPFCIQLLDDAIKYLKQQQADALTSTLSPSLQLSCKSRDAGGISLCQKPGPEEFMLCNGCWEKEDEKCEERPRYAKRATRWVEQQDLQPRQGTLAEPISLWQWNTGSKDSSPNVYASKYEALKTEMQVDEDNNRPLAGLKASKGALAPFEQDEALVTNDVICGIDAVSFSKASKVGSVVDTCQVSRPTEPSEPQKKLVSRNGCSAQPQRKTRRCWSPELHQRFLNALQQLGGSQVATPKQIRELMNVEGLTNDEVKSHLQKFRLHMRRPSPVPQSETQQPPHLVVFGGIWMPPEYGNHSPIGPTQGGGQSSLIPPPLLSQDFFSHLSTRQLGVHGSGYQEYRQSSLVCHNLMRQTPRLRCTGSQDDDSVECSSDERGGSESSNLNAMKQMDKKDRTDSTDRTDPLLSKETQEADINKISGWHGPYIQGQKDYTSHSSSSAHSMPAMAVGLKSFLGTPLHLSCGLSTYEDRNDKEISVKDESGKPESRTSNDTSEDDYNNTKKNSGRSGKGSEMRRSSETDLSIGCG